MKALLKESEAKYNEGIAFETLAKKEERDITSEELSKMEALWTKSNELKEKADQISLLINAKETQTKFFNEPLRGLMSDISDPETKERASLENKSTDEQMAIAIDHKAALNSYLRTKGSQAMDKFNAKWDGKIAHKALSRLTDPAGGYFVGTEFRNTVIEKRDQLDVLRPLCDVSSTSQSKVVLPAVADSFVFTMGGETESFTEETGDVAGQLEFTPHKGNALIKLSAELLEDSEFNIEAFIARRYGIALAKIQLDQWIDGTGTKQPQGVLRADITDHDIVTTTSGTIVPKDLADITMQLAEEYLTAGTRFVMPTATMSQILLLRTNADGADTGLFMWQPSFQAGVPATLQGYPVIRVPAAFWPTISSDGHPLLLFGDWGLYMIVDRIGLTIQRLDELYAVTDQIGFKVRARWDGKLSDVNAFMRLNRT